MPAPQFGTMVQRAFKEETFLQECADTYADLYFVVLMFSRSLVLLTEGEVGGFFVCLHSFLHCWIVLCCHHESQCGIASQFDILQFRKPIKTFTGRKHLAKFIQF